MKTCDKESTVAPAVTASTLQRNEADTDPAQLLLKLQRDLAIQLTFPGSLTETLDRILNTACRIEGIDSGGIYVIDYDKRCTDLLCHRGLSRAFVKAESHYPLAARQPRRLMKGRALYLGRAEIERIKSSSMIREGLRAVIVVPVRHANHVVASLNLASHTVDTISEGARHAIEAIAAQIGPTIARVKAETALHINERNLQTLFDSLGDFLFIADARGRLLHVNPLVQRRLGYSMAECRGQPITRMHPAEQRKQAAATVAAMLVGKAESCDVPLITKSGERIPVETKVVLGQWNGRKALFGISRDVTERNRSERKLLDRQRELQALVSKLALAEENERRRIAHGLHDDIGQMLASARWTLSHVATLQQRHDTRAMIAKVGGYLDHVLRVTRSLTFDLASPVLQRFGLEAAVEDLCDKMTSQYGIRFALTKDKGLPPLPEATEILVFHAVRELLRNAVTHAKARHVQVSLARGNSEFRVTVSDDGIGCEGVSAEGFNHEGGFGLYTIQERMQHLGGSFACEARQPHGTRIVLTVPLEPATAPPSAKRRHRSQS